MSMMILVLYLTISLIYIVLKYQGSFRFDIKFKASVKCTFNPLDAGRRLTDFSQTSYAAGSRLTYKTVNQRSGS